MSKRREMNELLQAGPEPGEIFHTIETLDPDYRYRYTKYLAECNQRLDPLGDSRVDRTLDYLWSWNTDEPPPPSGALDYPHLHEAFRIFYQPKKLTAIYIECGLLAGGKKKHVAEFLAVDWETITAYEELFFDVRPLLGKPGALARTVFRPMAAGIRRADHIPSAQYVPIAMDDVWRYISYHTSWNEYKKLVAGRDFDNIHDAAATIKEMSDDIKVTQAALMEEVSPNNIEDILDRYAEKVEREARKDAPESGRSNFWEEARKYFRPQTQDMRDEGMSAHMPCKIEHYEQVDDAEESGEIDANNQ